MVLQVDAVVVSLNIIVLEGYNMTTDHKHIIGGGLLLALGLSTGLVLSPDKLEKKEIESVFDSTPHLSIDVDQYNRTITSLRRSNVADILTRIIPVNENVKATINILPGSRIDAIEYIGSAEGKFQTISILHDDKGKHTTVIIDARNISGIPTRLIGLVHCTPQCME
jgi:hypothetical protein